MNRQGEKSIPFSGLDDKREIMMVLAVTIGGEICTSSDSLPVKSCNKQCIIRFSYKNCY